MNNIESLEAEAFSIEQKLALEPERGADALNRRHKLLGLIAKAQVRLELGQKDASVELEAAKDELATVDGEILLNGRRARALDEMLGDVRTRLGQARAAEASRLRAKWEPPLRARKAALEKAFLDSAIQYCTAIHLLEGIPPGFIDPSVVLRKLAGGTLGRGLSFGGEVESAAKALVGQCS